METNTIVVSANMSLNEIKTKIKEVEKQGLMKHLAILSGTNYFSIVQYEDGSYDLWFDDEHILRYATPDMVADFVFSECKILTGFNNWRKEIFI